MGGSGRGEETGMADGIFVPVRPGDKTAERISVGRSGTSDAVGQCGRISLASESKWLEWEHQYIIR